MVVFDVLEGDAVGADDPVVDAQLLFRRTGFENVGNGDRRIPVVEMRIVPGMRRRKMRRKKMRRKEDEEEGSGGGEFIRFENRDGTLALNRLSQIQ